MGRRWGRNGITSLIEFAGNLQIQRGEVRSARVTAKGLTNWSAGSVNFYGADSQFVNAASGVFNINFDGFIGSVDGSCAEFRNEGLLRKVADVGVTQQQMRLYNRGTVQIDKGQIFLSCGYVSSNPVELYRPVSIIHRPSHPAFASMTRSHHRPIHGSDPAPVIVPGSFTQTVSGELIELIAAHTPPGQYGIPGADYGQLKVFGNVQRLVS